MKSFLPAYSRRVRVRRDAFTLVELFVVIAIIGVLVAILLPVMSSVRAKADQAKCVANIRQLCIATRFCANENNMKYPAMHVFSFDSNVFMPDMSTSTWHDAPEPPSIGEVLAPYLGIQPVNTLDVSPDKVPVFLKCPAAIKNAVVPWIARNACYRYNGYATGRMLPSSGSSKAMLFIDVAWGDWTQSQFSHRSPVGINVAYADGHIDFMSYQDYHTLNPTSDGEYQHPLYMNGWLQQQ